MRTTNTTFKFNGKMYSIDGWNSKYLLLLHYDFKNIQKNDNVVLKYGVLTIYFIF